MRKIKIPKQDNFSVLIRYHFLTFLSLFARFGKLRVCGTLDVKVSIIPKTIKTAFVS